MKLNFLFEITLYAFALTIIFRLDVWYGAATVLLIIADNLKTKRMNLRQNRKTKAE